MAKEFLITEYRGQDELVKIHLELQLQNGALSSNQSMLYLSIGIVKAVVALHNFLMFQESILPRHERRYCPSGFVDSEEKNTDIETGACKEDVNKDTGCHPFLNPNKKW